MKNNLIHSGFRRLISGGLIVCQVLVIGSFQDLMTAYASEQATQRKPVVVNRTVPKVEPVPAFPSLLPIPRDQDISRARVFEEPLIPIGRPSSEMENHALAQVINKYLTQGNPEDLSGFESFLSDFPDTPWRISLLTNMGIVYRRSGYFTRALITWQAAWNEGRGERGSQAAAIVDRAIAEYAELNARLGRRDVLADLFDQIQARNIGGSAGERVEFAKQGLWLMQNRPGEAFRCGPMAVDRVLAYTRRDYRGDDRITNSQSTSHGMSLVQIRDLAGSVGWTVQIARRSKGSPVLTPAVVHWKSNHYAALVREQQGRYLVEDPTFGSEFWVSRAALDDESSGYFLVNANEALPSGWRSVEETEALTIFGKGNTGSQNPEASGGNTPTTCPKRSSNTGMCGYAIQLMIVGLRLTDIPLSYSPPRGPAVGFEVSYNQKDTFQPALFTYSNLGPKWTFNWLSYLKDDPANVAAPLYLYLQGAGQETYTGYDSGTQTYSRHMKSNATIVRTSTSPIRYERHLPDGSIEVFSQPDGAATFPRRVFMTEQRDPQGNALLFTYDASLRLVGVTDAIGQVTTISYDLTSDSLKITRVTDPFGRFATFEYTSAGRLARITDTIGITSEMSYGLSDFVNTLTTPYGRTTFVTGQSGTTRWIEATDPLGGTERVEFRHGAPGIPSADPSAIVPTGITLKNEFLQYRNTFYWDKRALSLYAGDYTKAVLYHWLHTTDLNVTSDVIESFKNPLENRIWFSYPGQTDPIKIGNSAQPAGIARVLDDGTTQLTRYEYNAAGMKTKETDPLGRETVYMYGTNNAPDPDPVTGTGLDLLEVRQKNGSGYDTLSTTTYNATHQPLTLTDAARQVTGYTYRSTGDLETIITPPRGSLTQAQRTTTFTYYPDNAALGPGRMQRITGPLSGATIDFAYDAYGRPRTVTEPDGYTITIDYDVFDRRTKFTYPDGTYEETTYHLLDVQSTRDRKGRWTHYFYDVLRRLVLTQDPLGQTVKQEWCTCGKLAKLIDAKNNATTWEFDAQNRVIKETRADGSFIQYVHEVTTSRLKRRTDALGQNADYTYFEDNNPQQVSYPNAIHATGNVSFTYDAAYNRMTTMTDGLGTTAYDYYPVTTGGTLGARQLSSIDGPLGNDTITYTYDELGRSLSRSINGFSANQTYDALGRIDTVNNGLGGFTYDYVNQTWRLASVAYPNGQTSTYSYYPNSADRRLQQIHHQTSNGATISKFDYVYDTVGNITTWTQQRDSGASAVVRAYDFGYDAGDQLTSAVYRTTDVAPTILTRYVYGYDPAGNRTAEQIDDEVRQAGYDTMNRLSSQGPGGALFVSGTLNEAATVSVAGKTATVAADNTFSGKVAVPAGTSTVNVVAKDYAGNQRTNSYEVTQMASARTFTYDADGNITSDSSRSFEWDAENRLLAVESGTHRSEFTYDGQSRRIRIVEKDNGATTGDHWFLWCGSAVCEERDNTGATVTKRFFPQGEQQGVENYFYTTDHLDSTREMTDSLQTVRARYEYDPYGRKTKILGDKDSAFGFGRHYIHSASGLLLTLYRAYDSDVSRWGSEDPLRFAAGNNLYTYVANNPINYADPLGLQALPKTIPTEPVSPEPPAPRPRPVPVPPPAPPPEPSFPPAFGIPIIILGAVALILLNATPVNEGEKVPEPMHPPDPDAGVADRVNPGRGCDGKCLPCPPIPVGPWKAPGSAHGSTNGIHWHWFEYNQNPKTCECFLKRMSGPTEPSLRP